MSESRGVRNHGGLASLLSERDLAVAADVHEPKNTRAFEFVEDRPADEVFPQSVASGGPTPEGVILWTRVSPEAYREDEVLAIEVAEDHGFMEPVFRGVVDDPAVIEAHDYTVKVDLDGALEPDSTYYYRFVYRETASRVGRCKTLPAPDSSPSKVSFAVLTCQNYLDGYYGVFHHVAIEDVDFLVHVGDFIYESVSGDFGGIGGPVADRDLEFPSGRDRVRGLEDYRYLYREYKSDGLLQKALENHTLIPARDDHEIANDVYWDYGEGAPKADHPQGDDPEFMRRLTADALHAWWEYMPARVEYFPEEDRLHDRFELWRSLEFGNLVNLIMTDERLFRCPPKKDGRFPLVTSIDPDEEPEDRTMLGETQLEWLKQELRGSDAVWTVWSDEVPLTPIRLGFEPLAIYPVQVGWDGYARERREILEVVDDHVDNFVSLTGDMHCYLAAYVCDDGGGGSGDGVGVELMTPALTSFTFAELLGVNRGVFSGVTEKLAGGLVGAFNPHVEYFNSHHNGYSVVEFTCDECTYRGYRVDKTVDSSDADRELVKEFRVPVDEVEIVDTTPG